MKTNLATAMLAGTLGFVLALHLHLGHDHGHPPILVPHHDGPPPHYVGPMPHAEPRLPCGCEKCRCCPACRPKLETNNVVPQARQGCCREGV